MTEQLAADICGLKDTDFGYYSPAMLPLAQSLLSTLANIELEFEQERDKVRSITDSELKGLMLARLEARHLTRREPYVRQLARLATCVSPGGSQDNAAS
jgi:hypothetical protein